jgi:general secretion pathway protein G
LTIVELMIAGVIVAVLSSIAQPAYQNYRERARVTQAMRDIAAMSAIVADFFHDAHAYPDSLANAGLGGMRNPYGYLKLGDKKAHGHARKNHSLVPINTDFDLYSTGPDGRSSPPLTAKHSRDDIVRASDGAFIGVASDY